MEPIVLKMNYYDHFSCLADSCHYHCCQEWAITVNKQDYTDIKKAKKSKELEADMQGFFKRNRSTQANQPYAFFTLAENGLCRALDENGLCRLQSECGYSVLPCTCKTFPRLRRQMASLFEESMSTGCEKVVQILLQSEKGLFFRKEIPDQKGLRELPYPLGSMLNYSARIEKRPLLKAYEDVRMLCLAILQDRRHSLTDRMVFLGVALEALDKLEKEEKLDQVPAWRNEFVKVLRADYSLDDYVATLPMSPVPSLIYSTRMSLRPEANSHYSDCLKKIFKRLDIKSEGDEVFGNAEKYQKALKHLEKYLKGREYFFENLMVNLFFSQMMPFSQESIWDDYVVFCLSYSYFRLICAGVMAPKKTDDDLIYAVTLASRAALHNENVEKKMAEHLARTKDNTLSHMAIILKGDIAPIPVEETPVDPVLKENAKNMALELKK